MAISDIEGLLKELYSGEVPEAFTMGTSFTSRALQAEKIKANTRAVVFNLETAPGGDFKGISFDDGAYPKGNQMTTKKGTVSSIGVTLGFNVTQLVEFATKNNKLAIAPVLEKQVAKSMGTFKLWLECLLNAPNNDGILEILPSNSSGAIYNINPAGTSGAPFGGYLLIPGGRYDIYDAATLLTKRSGGPYMIDPDGGLNNKPGDATPQVTFSTGAITGYVANDRVVAQDLVSASINPIGYHLRSDTSGTWQAINRTKIYAQSQTLDAAAATLDATLVRTLLHGILKFSGDEGSTGELTPYMAYEQYRNYQNAAQDISQIILGGVSGGSAVNKNFDLMMGEGRIEGRKILIGNHCDPTKAFWIDFSQFRWIETKALDFEKNEAGGYFFRPVSTTLGTPLASKSWYLTYMCNFAAVDVTRQGVIENLALP